MSNQQFVFGVDLDGVVADFTEGLRPIAAEWLGVNEDELAKEVTLGFKEWNLDECGGYDALHRYAVKERNLFQVLPAISGAAAALRRISTRGVRIRIITHRLYIEWFHKEAAHQTINWLEHHGVPYWDLCFMRDKAAVGADLYLEDNPANIEALRSTGHKTIVFTNSINKGVSGPRANSWNQVEQMVQEELKEWETKIGN